MNKNAIKKFAIEARKKLIDSVTDKAGMLGITEKSCSEPITKGADFEVYQTVAGTEVTLNKRQCEQRRRLVSQIESRGFEAVVEEVAYTWFNRICAIRFMEVNDYLPNRVRVLSSEKEGKMEPDLVTQAPDVDLDLTAQEKEEIINWKMSGTSENTDKLYCKLFLKQCHQLNDILPGLFEADSDYMELLFGISYTNKDDVIYMFVNPETGIPEADFNVSTLDEEGNPTGQVEIIGWLYQYYNTELKDDTFAKLKKNVKITKERIPAATQLFTPDWIVRYMVENSVGRIWIEHLRAVDPSTNEKTTAERFGWKYYLPEAEQEELVNIKLAEIRSTYKDLKPTDITCIDPCMGSGHILIAMFDVLMDIYESAGYDKREAAFEIVEHNIHGLDIDQRAYQLAYFAVMMKGRGYNRRFLRGRDGKPEPKVYAIVESNEINRNHLQFFGAHLSEKERNLAVMQIEGLLDTFKDAREYGSILNVDACDWDVLERFVDDLGTTGQISFESVGSEETQESLRKLVRMAKNLGQKYDAVVTNPPYMGIGNMGICLYNYVQEKYDEFKQDLYCVFIKKCMLFSKSEGIIAMISQQSFMFNSRFEKTRDCIINKSTYINMLYLGTRAFEDISGEKVRTCAFVKRNSPIEKYQADYIDLQIYSSEKEKHIQYLCLLHKEKEKHPDCYKASLQQYEKIPGKTFSFWISSNIIELMEHSIKLDSFAETRHGLVSGNGNKFMRLWMECNGTNVAIRKHDNDKKMKWYPYNKGGSFRRWYGNREYVINWENDGFLIRNYFENGKLKSSNYNLDYNFRTNISWSDIKAGFFSARYTPAGALFDTSGPSLFVKDKEEYNYILGFLNTKVAQKFLEVSCTGLHYSTGAVSSLPIIKWSKSKYVEIEQIVSLAVQLSIMDWDCFEISWDFTRHPLISVIPKYRILFDDISRITLSECYICWQNECNDRFNKLKTNEEKLNRIFIDIYGLQNELTPEVDDKDVTVRKADLSRDIRSFVSYSVGCMFGRYSLDKEGLILAGQKFESHFYVVTAPTCETGVTGAIGFNAPTGEYYYKTEDGIKKCSFSPDGDNCIPITDEEYFSDDIVARFVEFVKVVYGADTLEENLDFIAKALGNKGDTSREIIRNYFLKDFYVDHLKIYQKRPIYWLFDSGKQNGFKALIYMHRYDADTVGRVRTDYLHRAQKYVETAMQSAQYTIDNASSASEKSKATKAVTKYTKQLAEMKIYDEAIAHIANKRIEIDLDDGVKVNYEKFQGVEVTQEGKKALKVNLLAKI